MIPLTKKEKSFLVEAASEKLKHLHKSAYFDSKEAKEKWKQEVSFLEGLLKKTEH